MDELYAKLTCALMHDMYACDYCKQCGKDGVVARMNLVAALAKYLGKETPWEDNTTKE